MLYSLEKLSCIVSFIIIVTATPIYLSKPPYSFTTKQQGLTFIGAAIGAALGGPVIGRLNDTAIRILSRRNNGVFEAEMRLPMTTVPMLTTTAGLILFGVGVQNGDHWIVPVLGSTFVAVGLSSVPSTLQPYLLDNYFPASLDVFTVRYTTYSFMGYNSLTEQFFHGFKNLIVFGFAFGISPWISLNGIGTVFGILAAIVAFFDLCWIIFYIFGKKLRKNDGKRQIFPF